MLIFLDFDGVLRPKQSPLYRFDADCLDMFERAVRLLPEAQIVITSSWREAFSLGQMRRLFSPDIAERIVGVTPIEWSHQDHYRYREVLAFLKRNSPAGAAWMALDDDPLHYPPLRNLIVVDGECGFDSDAAARLLTAARELLASSKISAAQPGPGTEPAPSGRSVRTEPHDH
jgi:HAD domain in Swiss Army Knife RNA repair proteins